MLDLSETSGTAHNETWLRTEKQPGELNAHNVTLTLTNGYNITHDINNTTDELRWYAAVTEVVDNSYEQIAITSAAHKPNGSTVAPSVQFPGDYDWISPYENPDSSVTWGVLVAIIVVVICFLVAVILYARYRRVCSNMERIQDEPATGPPNEQTEIMIENTYDYIYKPVSGSTLDEEYETTFVGVSIPLLQEVTRI